MKITRAYQFRLYPTKEQEVLIHKTFGCTRFLYNQMLDEKKKNKTLGKYDLFKKIPEYIKNYSFLSEVDSCSLRNSITDLMVGFDRYYKNLVGYSNYQKRGVKESYRTNCNRSSYKGKEYSSIEVDLKENTITLPKLKKVKIRGYRKLEKLPGKILNATIKQVGNKYYVSVCVEEEIEIPVMSEKQAVGIDVGIKNMVVTSDGEYYKNPDFLKKYEIILAERLKIKEMLSKENDPKRVRKSISDVSFEKILQTIEYKCKWNGKIFHQVSSYYPSSQICSECGHKDTTMKDYGKRKYICPVCKLNIERDYNASRNILQEGLRELKIS